IKVLMITGGGWHDYKSQEVILRETITSRLNATVDVKWTSTDEHPVQPQSDKIPHVFTTDFAKGYDVVLHNHCHVGFQDDAAIDKVIDNHITNKVGIVMTHGSFHTFMRTKEQAWDRLCGCNSVRHVHHAPIEVKIMTKDHPVTKALGVDGWRTKQGELYTTTLNEGTINLAEGTTIEGRTQTDSCIFTHELNGNPMVGITLGHHNSTMEQAEYKDLITYSVLHAASKLDKDGKPEAGFLK
ncbi:MAG: ThuA domain-containing protein, partial [Verrucomicrobiota bacterium]